MVGDEGGIGPGPEAAAAAKVPVSAEALERLRIPEGSAGQAFLEEIIRHFLADVPTNIGAVIGAVRRGDAAAARIAAHKLKGTCLLLGAQDMADVCAEVENPAAGDEVAGGGHQITRLETAFEDVRAALEAELAHGRPG